MSKEPQFIRDVGPFFSPCIILITIHLINMFTGNVLLGLWMLLFVSPFSGYLVPRDYMNLSPKSEKAFANDRRFVIPLHLFTVLETLSWIWALIVMSDKVHFNHYYFNVKPETAGQYFAFSFIWGVMGGLNAIGGHELLHKKEPYNKYMGQWAYTKFCYSHFLDEHIKGHHKRVATPEDPATSRKNENPYLFVLRSAFGSHVSVWNMESERVKKIHGENVPFALMLFNNKMTWYFIGHTSMLALIYWIFGWESLKYQFVVIAWGIWFLETINYLEHYGLLRLKDKNGIYESVNKFHSWNSLSSGALFRLQRHSDHHAHSFRPYQILRRFDEAPYLPFDYL